MLISALAFLISVLRSSPKSSFNLSASSLIIPYIFESSDKIPVNSSINSISSLYSWLILSLSSPVSLCNLISRIAFAWISENLNFAINSVRATFASFEARIILITSSILSSAILNPSKIWALFLAFFNSNSVLLVITSNLCSRYFWRTCFKFNTLGALSTSASIITPNVFCKSVNL